MWLGKINYIVIHQILQNNLPSSIAGDSVSYVSVVNSVLDVILISSKNFVYQKGLRLREPSLVVSKLVSKMLFVYNKVLNLILNIAIITKLTATKTYLWNIPK